MNEFHRKIQCRGGMQNRDTKWLVYTLNTQTIQQPSISPTTFKSHVLQQRYTIIHNSTTSYHNLKVTNDTPVV